MRESLAALDKNIDALVSYIKNHETSKIFLNKLQTTNNAFKGEAILIESNTTTMRVFEYNCYIISLYGYFEQFIESILSEYIDALAAVHARFDDLPDDIKKNNTRKNAELLKNLELPKYRGIEERSVIEALHANVINNKTQINTIAFGHHSTNFRINSICDYFKNVGVAELGKKVSLYEPLKTQLEDTFEDYSSYELTKIYEDIDVLVERRNLVAHGTINDDILSINRIFDICNFIKLFAESLSNYLNTLVLERLFDENVETTNKRFHNLPPIAVYNNKILCVNSSNFNISVGNKVIITSASIPKFQEATIESIQIEGSDVDCVPSGQAIDIGLGLDKKIKETNSFYIQSD